MKRVLAIDLGVTTGWARVDLDTSEVLAHGTIEIEDLATQLYDLDTKLDDDDFVVIEKPLEVRGDLGDVLRFSILTAESVFSTIVYIPPSRWKPHPVAKTPLPGIKTTHERDAIHLGMFVAKTGLQGRL